jgi:hypothetical protein
MNASAITVTVPGAADVSPEAAFERTRATDPATVFSRPVPRYG